MAHRHPSDPGESEEDSEGEEKQLSQATTMDDVWLSFFNQVFLIAEEAVKSCKIPLSDVRQQEPYLYLSLIGATLLQCVVRSARRRRRSSRSAADDVLVLAADREIRVLQLPDVHRPAFELLNALKAQLPQDPDDLWCLEQMLLYGQSERKVVTALAEDTVVALRRQASVIQTVAIHISQQPMFREQFQHVLALLVDLYREL